MEFRSLYKGLGAAAAVAAGFLAVRYGLPVLLPFLLGALIALAAEPAVGFLSKKTGLPRGVAAGVGVSVTLVLLLGILSLVGALAVKELGKLALALPDAQQTLQSGMDLLQDAVFRAADRLPDGVQSIARGTAAELFDGSTALVTQMTGRVKQLLGALLGWLPDGTLGLGTGVLAGYMISARLPQLRKDLRARLPQVWFERYLPKLQRVRRILGGWLKAQGKLAGATWLLLAAGFTVLGIRYGVLWALPVAVVDAIPVLGTGVVLVPWALVCFLQGSFLRGVGLLVLCIAAMVTRRVLEPKLVGKQLGLDPLVTLLLLYLGYRFWGIWGMIVFPLLAAAGKSLSGAAQ